MSQLLKSIEMEFEGIQDLTAINTPPPLHTPSLSKRVKFQFDETISLPKCVGFAKFL